MKSLDSMSISPPVPSLFQIAALFEDWFPADGFRRSASCQLPFAEFKLKPDKLLAVLLAGKEETSVENQIAKRLAASKEEIKSAVNRPPGVGKAKSECADHSHKPRRRLPKKVEFKYPCPAASSVKLAGDFTDWMMRPIEMMHSSDGIWFTVVPLAPGDYSYRFIVDGQWCDDPHAADLVPNPFGTQNAILRVS